MKIFLSKLTKLINFMKNFPRSLNANQTRTVARNVIDRGLYVCAGDLYVRTGGLDIQI